MKTKLLGLGIAVIVVVAAIALVFPREEASPYWETETQFGSWGEEILIEYEDGTVQSLKVLQNIPAQKLTYEGDRVNTIWYVFKAKATGTGYTAAVIKFTSLSVAMKVTKGGTQHWSGSDSFGTFDRSISLDDQWHTVNVKAGESWADIFDAKNLPAGTYTISFTPSGSAKYWGDPGQTESDATSITLPAGKTITVVWTPDNELTVILGSDFVW